MSNSRNSGTCGPRLPIHSLCRLMHPHRPVSDWKISFEGKDKLECQGFVAAVNRHAFYNGKDEDDNWVARYAGACIAGDALAWYVGLDEDVRRSWQRLRVALLAEHTSASEETSAASR